MAGFSVSLRGIPASEEVEAAASVDMKALDGTQLKWLTAWGFRLADGL